MDGILNKIMAHYNLYFNVDMELLVIKDVIIALANPSINTKYIKYDEF